jgi:hypothetical protein
MEGAFHFLESVMYVVLNILLPAVRLPVPQHGLHSLDASPLIC